MKKILAVLIMVAMIFTMLCGCGQEKANNEKANNEQANNQKENDNKENDNKQNDEKKDDTEKSSTTYLRWNIGAEPKTFDPGLNNASDGGHIIMNTFEGLMQDSETGAIPGQAERYEVSDDGTVYTFYLRNDIQWSDGKPVTAGDFEYSWKRVCDAKTASEYSFIMAPYIKNGQQYLAGECSADEFGVKALDDKTLQVTLEFPCSYFLSLLSFYTYMPVRQDIVEANGEGWEKKPETFICNGPFVLEEYVLGDHLKLKKNEKYYDAENVHLAGIYATMLVEETTMLNAYEAGDLDIIDTVPNDEIPRLKAEDPNFHIDAQVGTYYAIFNCDKAPFNDVRVRKAFALAIDRTLMVEQVTKGGQIPATGFIPPNLSYSDGSSCRKLDKDGNCLTEYDIDPLKANVELAKQLMADAGYPNGEGFPTITYLYNTSEGHQKIGEALQEMWKNNLGVTVKLKNEEWATFQDTRRLGHFDIARGGWLGDYPEPMTMLDLFTSYSGNNDAQWRYNEQPIVASHDKTLNPENEEFDKAINEAMTTTGATKDAAYKKAEDILMGNYVIMPIYYYTDLYCIDESSVEGVTMTRMDHWVFKNARMLD